MQLYYIISSSFLKELITLKYSIFIYNFYSLNNNIEKIQNETR